MDGGKSRTIRKGLVLGREACRLLEIHAAVTEQTESAVVSDLIEKNLDLYVIDDLGDGPGGLAYRTGEPVIPPGGESSAEEPGKARGKRRAS